LNSLFLTCKSHTGVSRDGKEVITFIFPSYFFNDTSSNSEDITKKSGAKSATFIFLPIRFNGFPLNVT